MGRDKVWTVGVVAHNRTLSEWPGCSCSSPAPGRQELVGVVCGWCGVVWCVVACCSVGVP